MTHLAANRKLSCRVCELRSLQDFDLFFQAIFLYSLLKTTKQLQMNLKSNQTNVKGVQL